MPQTEEMIRAIKASPTHGLQPADYHIEEIDAVIADLRNDLRRKDSVDAEKLASLDLLLTDAFLLYASHMLSGRIDPGKYYVQWVASPRSADLASILQDAIEGSRVEKNLKKLEPDYVGYENLKKALANYRMIAAKGGWGTIHGGKNTALKRGSSNALVPALRTRLMLSGDLSAGRAAEGEIFDDSLHDAVISFQRRHNLKDDGVVRAETIKALNVPVEKRIRQMELNMERWRWLPLDLGKRYILVSVTDFSLKIVRNDKVDMEMKVIVGKRIMNKRTIMHTPIFSAKMTHLEINPYWNVPHSIASKELLPLIKKDPSYLSRKNMMMFSGRGKVDPTTVDWTTMHEKNFRYQIRQNPGAFNALSHIKFLFPNRFDVYLHDTPTRNLFNRMPRDFSHGCMRIEKPIDMAVYLLNDPNTWSREKILAVIKKGRNHPVYLPEVITVHVQYWTSWVENDGTVNFRDDIYGYDPVLDRALTSKLPVPVFPAEAPKQLVNGSRGATAKN